MAANAERRLRAEGLCKSYGKRTVVSGVSLSLATGQVIGLLYNGAGKTTAFYMVVGLTAEGGAYTWMTRISPPFRCICGLGGESATCPEASVFRKLSCRTAAGNP